MIVSRSTVPGSAYGKAHTRPLQLRITPISVSGSGHTRNLISSLKLSFICKSASQAALINSRMQLTLHATRRTTHGASRLVQAMSLWLVKTRRAPSRHRRNARVYGHTTTAMHEYRLTPHPLFHPCSLSPSLPLLLPRPSPPTPADVRSFVFPPG